MKTKVIKVVDIIKRFEADIIAVKGEYSSITIDNVADPQHTNETTLDWINSTKQNKQEIAEETPAKVIIVPDGVEYTSTLQNASKVLIYVKKPRMMMAKIITEFFIEKPVCGIHPSAVVDKDAIVEPGASIGAGCVIGRAKIGAGTILMPNVVVYDDVTIGSNCIIQAGAVIGTDGLGCMREEDGTLVKFPHLGGVIIGSNVEIGANCQIAKGALSDTMIDDGCKINGLCFIAHNSHLENNVWITGDTMLCGSTHVDKNSVIFSNVIIREQSHIGSGVTIGMGSVVTKNIPDGETWYGSPAKKAEKK